MNETERIRQARKSKGYTQDFVAQQLGMSRPSYIKFEAGSKELGELTLNQANRLKELFGEGVTEPLADVQRRIKKYRDMILALIYFGKSKYGGITKTKLAKMLYFADAQTYLNQGRTMSGMIYRKLPQGPVAYEYLQLIDDMSDKQIINIRQLNLAQMISTVEPVDASDLRLEDNEIRLLEDIATKWRDKRTDAIVNYSHEHPTWLQAEDYQPIDWSLLRQMKQSVY